MTTKKKVTFYADHDIAEWLAAESARVGAPVGELCRRAVRLAAFGEAQTSKNAPRQQPVLFVQKAETLDSRRTARSVPTSQPEF
jgi:hypothetical protein